MFGIFTILYSLVFLANSTVILNNKRFLSRIGLPLEDDKRMMLSKSQSKIVDLLKAIRTILRIPLIIINIIFIIYELFIG